MTTVFCDDVYCKIEIVPGVGMPGVFWVVLDGDDDMTRCATSHGEAVQMAEELYAEFVEDNGLSGVGS